MIARSAAVAFAVLSLAACSKQVEAPTNRQVCWHVVFKGEDVAFNKLPGVAPNLESCAAALEAMRIRFLRLGGNQQELVGAYQGNFLFLQREGIFTSTSLTKGRYLALVRTGDGRLAIPGAMPSPPR
jgi:hypothetical protein